MSQFDLGLPLLHAGKVRQAYAYGEAMLLVATDNVSAFDYVLPVCVPDKGIILTQLSTWWFHQLSDLVANHMLDVDVPPALAGRAMVVEPLAMVPTEAVVRGYLTGSGWAEYQRSRSVCGVELPEGLHDGSRLAEPIFTPAFKAPMGQHDQNITFTQLQELAGTQLAEQIRDVSLAIYRRAESIAAGRGLILADTKFEFGCRSDGQLVLADEVLTPDSSRFWDAEQYAQGQLVSFDKQYLRDWLTQQSGWDKSGPPPTPPAQVIAATRQRYVEAFTRLTGHAPKLAVP